MPDPFVLLAPGVLDDRQAGDRVPLPDGVVHHLRRVLRLRDGARVEAADGAGVEVTARLQGDDLVLLVPPLQRTLPHPRLEVLQGLGKGRKHDEVVRTLTELGVDAITAVASARSVVDWDEARAAKARQRWLKVATSACGQARRADLPDLDGPVDVATAVARLDGAVCLVADVGAEEDPLQVLEGADTPDRVVLAVGPEGGWTDDEVASFVAAGARLVALGPTVLRTEHAATVLASVAAAATGRLRPGRLT